MANPNWIKGKSGNPNGRPKKDRALTAILETAGGRTVQAKDGRHVARRRMMAELLWQAVTDGRVELPTGKVIEMGAEDWFDTVQFLYKHIDGAPVQKIAPTTPDGENPYMSMEAEELIRLAKQIADTNAVDTGE